MLMAQNKKHIPSNPTPGKEGDEEFRTVPSGPRPADMPHEVERVENQASDIGGLMSSSSKKTGPLGPLKTGGSTPSATGSSSVAEHVNRLTNEDSVMQQRARARGAQASNRRGLMNTSMGVQAGETAAYDAALPIAQQDAGQVHQQRMHSQQLRSNEVLTRDQMRNQRDLQEQDIRSREFMQGQSIEAQTLWNQMDRETRERISGWNIDSSERIAAAQAGAAVAQNHSAGLAAIMSNPDIPIAERNRMIRDLDQRTESSYNYAEQIFGVDIRWDGVGGGPGGGPGGGSGGGSGSLGGFEPPPPGSSQAYQSAYWGAIRQGRTEEEARKAGESADSSYMRLDERGGLPGGPP